MYLWKGETAQAEERSDLPMTGSQECKEPQGICEGLGQKQGPLNLNDESD